MCWKEENKEKEAGMAHFFKNKQWQVILFGSENSLLQKGAGDGGGWIISNQVFFARHSGSASE